MELLIWFLVDVGKAAMPWSWMLVGAVAGLGHAKGWLLLGWLVVGMLLPAAVYMALKPKKEMR